jgi:hypothetical protein
MYVAVKIKTFVIFLDCGFVLCIFAFCLTVAKVMTVTLVLLLPRVLVGNRKIFMKSIQVLVVSLFITFGVRFLIFAFAREAYPRRSYSHLIGIL